MTNRPLKPHFLRWLALCVMALLLAPGLVLAKTNPEDLLKGKVIMSDKPIPTHWSSVGSYVAQLKGLNKTTFWYDKKTGKVTVQYAAFFAAPVNDVQVNLVVYDISGRGRTQKVSSENFMNRGDRVLFNSVTLDRQDMEGNKKYLFAIEYNHRVIASSEIILRVEQEKYSGKVSFSEDETKGK
ncbi:MAG: hypothetical protein ABI321_10430 [Polyangia bacterium]